MATQLSLKQLVHIYGKECFLAGCYQTWLNFSQVDQEAVAAVQQGAKEEKDAALQRSEKIMRQIETMLG
jgi:hypothetical protein